MKPNFYLKIRRIYISGGWYSGESFKLFSLTMLDNFAFGYWKILSIQITNLGLTIAWY